MASQKILILGLGIINLICSSNYITANDSISIVENITSNSKCTITQSAVLSSRLNKAIEITDVSHDNAVEKQYISGYRIQIFSDNNSRTAKTKQNLNLFLSLKNSQNYAHILPTMRLFGD